MGVCLGGIDIYGKIKNGVKWGIFRMALFLEVEVSLRVDELLHEIGGGCEAYGVGS